MSKYLIISFPQEAKGYLCIYLIISRTGVCAQVTVIHGMDPVMMSSCFVVQGKTSC